MLAGVLGRVAEVGGFIAGDQEVDDLELGSNAQFLRFVRAHDYQRGSGIVEAGGVAGRDGCLFVVQEAGAKLSEFLHGRIPAGTFIRIEDSDLAFAALDLDGNDLILEFAGFDRGDCSAVAFRCEGVLLFSGDVVSARDVLCADAVVLTGQGPGQNIDDAVFEALVAHACAPSCILNIIRKLGEAFRSCRDDDIRVTGLDQHRGVRDGLKAGTALAVDGVSSGLLGKACLEADRAGDESVLCDFTDVADDQLIDIIGRDAGSLYGFLDNDGAQVDRGHVLEASAIASYRCAACAYNNNILEFCHDLCSPFIIPLKMSVNGLTNVIDYYIIDNTLKINENQ